ncbi:MAG: hypothetical protein HXX12_11640 [Geothrix sp.]|uniref:hypothetical protein n=1 Tax=Geothrix sp. TaxID=1962974 RepID=UPI0017C87D21|nr:hypothetical protein [Geothrix sp.]NWJ41611.1 hypothetical protein [Geothrix sp.]WIL20407.1 MAG: hypothetical protein QOZ81_002976 [Geothrix sp.]
MSVNAISALSSYAYQSALSQTGSSSQAMSQGLAMVQSQVAEASSLFSNSGATDPLAALSGSSSLPALSSLTYSASAASGNGSSAVQDLLSSLSGSQGSAPSAVTALPWSVALLSPSSAQALVRYAYDQSQNPSHTAAQAAAAGQQTLLASGLNLLA